MTLTMAGDGEERWAPDNLVPVGPVPGFAPIGKAPARQKARRGPSTGTKHWRDE